MKTKTKKRNPQDATLRNIRALKKRIEKLERHYKGIKATLLILMRTK